MADRNIDLYNLSKIQLEEIKKPCPACETGKLYPVEGTSDIEGDEDYLWCDNCDLSMDGSGGYIN